MIVDSQNCRTFRHFPKKRERESNYQNYRTFRLILMQQVGENLVLELKNQKNRFSRWN